MNNRGFKSHHIKSFAHNLTQRTYVEAQNQALQHFVKEATYYKGYDEEKQSKFSLCLNFLVAKSYKN